MTQLPLNSIDDGEVRRTPADSRKNGMPTPCRGCGRPVVFVRTATGKTVPLDPSAPVFVRQRDGDGGAIWEQDTSGELLVSHFATCSRANEFSGRNRAARRT